MPATRTPGHRVCRQWLMGCLRVPGPAAAPGTTVQPEPSGVSEQSGFWDPLKGRAGPPADDNVWVTVFGFQPGQLQLVMREFAKCGDIVHVGNGREDSANWVHIQYAVRPLVRRPSTAFHEHYCR